MPKISISFVVICRDEERTIKRCLNAIEKNIEEYDEIIVIDTGSQDKTLDIIYSNFTNVKIFNFKWENDFSAARNYGIKKAKKDWIFFIDADETLQKDCGYKVRNDINQAKKITNNFLVLVPKIINENSVVTYNTGRIIPNNSHLSYFGLVHEYPIIDRDMNNKDYDEVVLPDIVLRHDGYKTEVVNKKDKPRRNSLLDKKMLEILPNSIRYNYFYYHDGRTLLGSQEYVNGLKKTFCLNKKDRFAKVAICELIVFYIKQGKYNLADYYINEVSKYLDENDQHDLKWQLAYISAVNEFEKLQQQELKLLQTLKAIKINHKNDLDKIFEKGMNYDELMGFINLSLGNIEEANKICDYLKKNNFSSELKKSIKKYKS